ncbi:MAG: zinc ABC transporter substrate-binding protein [Clostridia bacterium]|nr:zinc ABC transporter substrate-binding protein [Clostridia bacterium]
MKKSLLALLLIFAMMLVGCAPTIQRADENKQIYASFYPIYAISSLMLEDISGIGLKCLVQPQDDCLRLYELSDWDASVLAYDADAIIIGGNGLESFEDALYTFGDDGPAIITSSHGIDLYGKSNDTAVITDADHFEGLNPHAYMSVEGASQMVSVIGGALKKLYSDKSAEIEAGISKAETMLTGLETQISEVRKLVSCNKVIIMHESLFYLAQDYGLEVAYVYKRESGTTLYGDGLHAALDEISTAGSSVVMIEKQAPAELTDALKEAGYTVVLIDTMSSFTADSSGKRYIDAQLANAKSIADAFR